MSGDADGGSGTGQPCARCGNPVSQATSYLTEVGLLCWPCFGNYQSQQAQAARRDVDLQQSLTRLAKVLAGAHWVMVTGFLIFATGHLFPAEGRSVLLLIVAGLGIGLFLRLRWAYQAALVLDSAGILGLAALAIAQREALILVGEVFPAALLVMTWTLRSAYAEELPLAGYPAGGTQ